MHTAGSGRTELKGGELHLMVLGVTDRLAEWRKSQPAYRALVSGLGGLYERYGEELSEEGIAHFLRRLEVMSPRVAETLKDQAVLQRFRGGLGDSAWEVMEGALSFAEEGLTDPLGLAESVDILRGLGHTAAYFIIALGLDHHGPASPA